MTFLQFKHLSESDQEFIIWNKGTELAARENATQRFYLYQVDGFYVEIRCDKNHNRISGFFFFDSLQYLEPYLVHINIKDVYS